MAVVIAALVSVVVVVARIGVADAASFVVLSILKQKSKKQLREGHGFRSKSA